MIVVVLIDGEFAGEFSVSDGSATLIDEDERFSGAYGSRYTLDGQRIAVYDGGDVERVTGYVVGAASVRYQEREDMNVLDEITD